MNDKNNQSKVKFDVTPQAGQVERDHRQALSSARLAKGLVRSIVRLDRNQQTERKLYSPRLGFGFADPELTTSALQAELRAREIKVNAVVETRWDKTCFDAGYDNILKITEIDGVLLPDEPPKS